MAAVPFHLHPGRAALLERAPQLAAAVLERAGRGAKRWDRHLDVEAVIATFQLLAEVPDVGGLRAVILNDSHFLAFSIGPFWFNPGRPWLVEQFYMRIGRGSADDALADVKALALAEHAGGVIMATSLAANDAALGRLLGRHGYSPQSSQHILELP